MRKVIPVFLLFGLLATVPLSADAAQKRRPSVKKGVSPPGKISIPPGTVEKSVKELFETSTKRVKPQYPEVGCQTRPSGPTSGDVLVVILVDENGKVIAAAAKRGPALLRQSAIDAARQWEFQPLLKDGQPIKFTGTLTFRFQ